MRKSYQKLAPYLWRYRRGIALGMGALIVKDVVSALLPLLFGWGVDSLTKGFSLPKLYQFGLLLVFASAVKGIFQYWMRVILIGMSRDVEFDLRNDLFAHLIRLSHDFCSKYRTGDIMARATNDLNAVRMMLGPGLMYWTETMLTFVCIIAVMAWVDLPLTVIAIAPAPVVSIVLLVFGRIIHARFEHIQKRFSEISSRG